MSINPPPEIIAALLQRYREMRSAMRSLDDQAEANVTRWQWATGQYYSLRPLYHERYRHYYGRGQLLPDEPTKAGEVWLFGFDARGQLLARYHYRSFQDPDEAVFFLYKPDHVEMIGYTNTHFPTLDSAIINGVGRLYGTLDQPEWYMEVSGLFGGLGVTYEVYHYTDNRLSKVQVQNLAGTDEDAPAHPQTHHITYTAGSKPKVTIDDPQRRDLESALGVVNSGDKAEDSVIESLCQTVINAIKTESFEGVRCWLEIGYDAVITDGVLLILGRESDRIAFMDWTYDRSFNSLQMHGDAPGRRAMDIHQAEWSKTVAKFIKTRRKRKDWNAVSEFFRDAAQKLNEYDWGSLIAVTEDFIVFAYDYESHDDIEPFILDSVPESKIDLWRVNGWFS